MLNLITETLQVTNMDEKPTVVTRGKITYYIFKNSVLADIDGWQYLSYNIYNNSNRGSLRKFKKRIENSTLEQYANALDLMELAMEYNLTSVGANRPKDEWRA